jgi:hypothetical protein
MGSTVVTVGHENSVLPNPNSGEVATLSASLRPSRSLGIPRPPGHARVREVRLWFGMPVWTREAGPSRASWRRTLAYKPSLPRSPGKVNHT